MSKYEQVLKAMDILLDDLTPEQLEKIKQFSEKITDPNKMKPQQALELVKDLGIDIEKLQRNSRRLRAEQLRQNHKPRLGVNEKCHCQSGKKYKKCCMWKDIDSEGKNDSL